MIASFFCLTDEGIYVTDDNKLGCYDHVDGLYEE